MRWFELRLAGASGRCTTAGAPRRNAGTGGRPLQPAVCWSRLWRSPCSGPFDMLGTQTRRSFRDRRIPMRPDVPPGGASPVGEQRVLRSRRLGPGPTCRSGDGSPEKSPWAICTICTARRGRWADGSGKWRERGYQPAFSARPYGHSGFGLSGAPAALYGTHLAYLCRLRGHNCARSIHPA